MSMDKFLFKQSPPSEISNLSASTASRSVNFDCELDANEKQINIKKAFQNIPTFSCGVI